MILSVINISGFLLICWILSRVKVVLEEGKAVTKTVNNENYTSKFGLMACKQYHSCIRSTITMARFPVLIWRNITGNFRLLWKFVFVCEHKLDEGQR